MYMYLTLITYLTYLKDDVTNVSHDKLEKNVETTKKVVTLASSPNAKTLGDFQVLLNQPPIEEADCVSCTCISHYSLISCRLHR